LHNSALKLSIDIPKTLRMGTMLS